jgi:hypothetical protein
VRPAIELEPIDDPELIELLPIVPILPLEPPFDPTSGLVPGVVPGGLTVPDLVAFGSIVGAVGPEPLLLPSIG